MPSTADIGLNTVVDPLFVSFTNNGNPSDDDLTLEMTSPAINSGPSSGVPIGLNGYYSDWADPDGSQNDRGYTGGSNAQ